MDDDKPVRVPLAELTEWWAEQQRRNHERVLAECIERLRGFKDEHQDSILTEVRRMLAEEFERGQAAMAALAARGTRMDDEPLH
jgi:hypothetical protein